MNTITNGCESHDFATVPELLALPMVKVFTDDPAVSHLAQGGNQLQPVRLIEGRPVMHVIGTLAQPVILPASIPGSSQPANNLGESK